MMCAFDGVIIAEKATLLVKKLQTDFEEAVNDGGIEQM